ncbi:GTP-binding protein [Nocardia tengchongensis]|uniref:GTP-binding protein n=1 Tax=Nocardia tengchongensis TaxID=2055889 RepID=UPI0036B8AFC4
MATKAIDPQSIRNVTLIGDPADTTRLLHRLHHGSGHPGPQLHWSTDRADHTIRVAELSSHAPIPALQRAIRVADSVITVVDAAGANAPRLETILQIADDHQVARLCLIEGLDHPAANFPRCLRTIADIRGATPLTLQLPLGTGPTFEGVIDLLPMWALEPLAAEIYGPHWQSAERGFDLLVKTLMPQTPGDPTPSLRDIPLDTLHHRIRALTRIGDIVPILCGAASRSNDIAPLLDAIARYLPSPMDVCQPEHALDY